MMVSLFQELKRRNVFKVAVAYIIVGWVILQVSDTISPLMNLPDWAESTVLFFLFLGFPVAVFFSWVFELTPEGLKLEKNVDPESSTSTKTGRTIDFIIIGALVFAIGGLVWDRQYNNQEVAGKIGDVETTASIAVLPFINISSDPEQEYFSDGISEELLNVLTKIPNLKVAGRTASFAYKGKNPNYSEVGENLNVGHVLEGSVRKSGNTLRVTAQLIRAEDGFHMWSKTYDRELTDIFDIQDELSKAIAESLAVSMGIETGGSLITDRTDVPEAYAAYLKARQGYAARGPAVKDGLININNALEFDPNFVPAWALLAKIYSVYPFYVGKRTPDHLAEYSKLTKIVANKALILDPNSAEAMVALANAYRDSREFALANELFSKAIKLAPRDADARQQYGELLIMLGYTERAVEHTRIATELDPGVPILMDTLAWAMIDNGEFEESERILLEALEINPILNMLLNVYTKNLAYQGRYDDLIAFYEEKEKIGVTYAQENLPTLRSIVKDPKLRTDPSTPILINLAMVNELPFDRVFGWGLVRAFEKTIVEDSNVSLAFLPPYNSGLWRDPNLRNILKKVSVFKAWQELGFPKYCKPVGEDDFMCGPEINLEGRQ